jgi:hypothetical protein
MKKIAKKAVGDPGRPVRAVVREARGDWGASTCNRRRSRTAGVVSSARRSSHARLADKMLGGKPDWRSAVHSVVKGCGGCLIVRTLISTGSCRQFVCN